MVRLSFKNTFISCEDLGDVEGDAACRGARGVRSRSVGCESPSRELDQRPRSPSPVPEQMERLNRLLHSDIPTEGGPDALRELLGNLTCGLGAPRAASVRAPQAATESNADPELEELRRLRLRLQAACEARPALRAPSGSPRAEEPLKMHTVWSSGSVSTMASDNAATTSPDRPRSTSVEGLEHGRSPASRVEFGMAIEETSARPVAGHSGLEPSGRCEHQPRYRHPQVPRPLNLAAEYGSANHDGPPTTLMIRNVPNLYTQRELVAELGELGLTGTFDFLYAPLDKGTLSNVGYAFVNFVNPEWASRCATVLHQHRFRRHRKVSGRTASVSVAHIQGLEKNLAHYEHTAVNSTKLKQHRPVVLANIAPKTECAACPRVEWGDYQFDNRA